MPIGEEQRQAACGWPWLVRETTTTRTPNIVTYPSIRDNSPSREFRINFELRMNVD